MCIFLSNSDGRKESMLPLAAGSNHHSWVVTSFSVSQHVCLRQRKKTTEVVQHCRNTRLHKFFDSSSKWSLLIQAQFLTQTGSTPDPHNRPTFLLQAAQFLVRLWWVIFSLLPSLPHTRCIIWAAAPQWFKVVHLLLGVFWILAFVVSFES